MKIAWTKAHGIIWEYVKHFARLMLDTCDMSEKDSTKFYVL